MMRRSFYECSVCRAESLDPDETPRHKVTPFVQAGQVQLRADVVCQECVELCPFCGEYVTDEFARLGVGVRFRDWTDEGRLTPIYHAFCAGEAFSGMVRQRCSVRQRLRNTGRDCRNCGGRDETCRMTSTNEQWLADRRKGTGDQK